MQLLCSPHFQLKEKYTLFFSVRNCQCFKWALVVCSWHLEYLYLMSLLTCRYQHSRQGGASLVYFKKNTARPIGQWQSRRSLFDAKRYGGGPKPCCLLSWEKQVRIFLYLILSKYFSDDYIFQLSRFSDWKSLCCIVWKEPKKYIQTWIALSECRFVMQFYHVYIIAGALNGLKLSSKWKHQLTSMKSTTKVIRRILVCRYVPSASLWCVTRYASSCSKCANYVTSDTVILPWG